MPRNQKIDAQAVLERIHREGPDALLTRGEAAAVIAERVKDRADTDRSARNRIGLQLDRDRSKGGDPYVDKGIVCNSQGQFTADEIAYWASIRYPGQFSDLPTKPRVYFMVCCDGMVAGSETTSQHIPGTLKECQAALAEAIETIGRMHRERHEAEQERKRRLVNNFRRK